MAIRKDSPRTARAIERAALQEKYKGATLLGLQAMEENRLNNPQALKDLNRELRKYYTDARAIAQKSINRIQKSDVPFTDETPQFPKTSELSKGELFRAIADVNRFLRSPLRELKPRREAYRQLLEDLHNKGMTYLKFEDLKYWERFRKWVRASNFLGRPYASGDILGDIFAQSIEEQNPTSERWQELYNEVSNLMGKKKQRKRRSRLGRRK